MSQTPPYKIVVQKYGGSSVADVDKLKHVAKRVVATAQKGYRVAVVISAMGKTTNELIDLAHQVSETPSRRELDMLVSAGERIAMSLLAMAIGELGHEAVSFTGSQCGIITSHRHSDARILEVRPYRVQDELDSGKIVIIAGYQGVSYKREVTTLGRGGSDTTAVAMAAALNAEYCEICSDVDGVYSADPRLIKEPKHLESLSYDEMQELAHHGAKVLNAQAVEFARKHRILIYAKATEGSDQVTRIAAESSACGALGLTTMDELALVQSSDGVHDVQHITKRLAAHGMKALWIQMDQTQPYMVLDTRASGYGALRNDLNADRRIKIEEGYCALSVVGQGIGDDPLYLQRLLDLAEEENVTLVGINSAPLRVSLLCKPTDMKRFAQKAHDSLCLMDEESE